MHSRVTLAAAAALLIAVPALVGLTWLISLMRDFRLRERVGVGELQAIGIPTA